ncbi:MAG: chemotaxis protein CheW [Betaproteobacteria bacterium]|nr:chemotaxis protein CheW [Betaproteobacteria bacterium]
MQTLQAAGEAAQAGREYLSFVLGDAQYCIDILKVQEIRTYEQPTRIANTPAFIKGVINLRGNIVPIVDLRVKFGLAESRYDSQTVVIVLNIARRTIGVVVDGVSDVMSVPASEIKPPPELSGGLDTKYLQGLATVNGQMLILIDIEKLMTSRDMAIVDEAAAAE